MRLLPLWQPWATLIAIGAKQWETRNRATPYRGRIAIFACQKWSGELRALIETTPFAQALTGGIPRQKPEKPPLAQIIATADLTDVLTTEEWMRQYCRRQQPPFPLRVTELLGKFDALDQLTDEAEPGETLHAYVITEPPRGMHILIRGKDGHRGGFFAIGVYKLAAEQPPQETMRDNALWRAWTETQPRPVFQ